MDAGTWAAASSHASQADPAIGVEHRGIEIVVPLLKQADQALVVDRLSPAVSARPGAAPAALWQLARVLRHLAPLR